MRRFGSSPLRLRVRSLSRGFVGASLATALAMIAAETPARAAEPDDKFAAWTLGLTPMIGVGMAKMSAGTDFPTFVGMSVGAVELQASLARVGVFVRAGYLSSGSGGRWTAPTLTLGASYRLFGDGYEDVGVLLRGGFTYERWHASSAGCAVNFFIPTNCKLFEPPAGSGLTTQTDTHIEASNDAFGITPSVRVELPVKSFYLALDGDVAVLASAQSGAPGVLFETRFAIVVGVRHRRHASAGVTPGQRRDFVPGTLRDTIVP
jgi:hypothetical protein